MHRARLRLEDWHYQRLKARAERENRSLSSLIREILDQHLQGLPAAAGEGLRAIEGLGADPEFVGRDHDRILYGSRGRCSTPTRLV